MQDKLKALTEKLYNEGIEAGISKGDALLLEAKSKADKLLETAKSKASEILKKAEEESALKHKQTMSELKLATEKALSSIKQTISKLISDDLFNEPVDKALKDKSFVETMILTILESWAIKKGEQIDIKIHLAKVKEKDLEKFISSKCKDFLNKGCEIVFDDGVKSGFKIGPKDGAYSVEFSEESFKSFFKNYLRPEVQSIIFGNKA